MPLSVRYELPLVLQREPAYEPPPSPQREPAEAKSDDGELVDQLQKLNELRESGALTEEEYSRAKQRILD